MSILQSLVLKILLYVNDCVCVCVCICVCSKDAVNLQGLVFKILYLSIYIYIYRC